MAVSQAQITIPSNGSQVVVLSGIAANGNEVKIRNTGTNTLLLGPPTVLPPPSNLVAVAVGTGGSFAANTYYWMVTALNASGETIGSIETLATVVLNGSANLTWNAVPSATNYKVYRAATSGGEFTSPARITTTGSTSYTDTGTAPSSGAVPVTNTAVLPVLFPLLTNEYLGISVAPDDVLLSQVQTPGTAGQITILALG